jgi:putative transposase
MADHGVIRSMSRSGTVQENAAMESFFPSLKTERTARKTYRMRDAPRGDHLRMAREVVEAFDRA